MKKVLVLFAVLLVNFGCKNTKTETSKESENQKNAETVTNDKTAQNEEKLDEFVYRTNEGVMKVFVKLDNQTFNPTVLKFMDKGSNEAIDLKISNISNDRVFAENPKTNEKLEFTKDFGMVAVMYRNGKDFTFNRETICYSKDGAVLTTSAGPVFLPFFYAPNSQETPKEIKVPDVTTENHPKYPDASYFKGVLPDGKKVDIIGHAYQDNNPKTQITLIIDGKETVFEEKK